MKYFVFTDNFQLPSFLQALVDKPHLERSNSERETVYEKVADQLASIADNYDFKSPLSPQRAKLQSSPPDTVEPGMHSAVCSCLLCLKT